MSSTALEYLAQAERAAAEHPELVGVAARSIRSVGVIGAGTMGSGIAIAGLDAGFDVTLIEVGIDALERGRTRIADFYADRVRRGKLVETDARDRMSRLTASVELQRLASVDLVIEAVFEDIEIKKELFGRLDGVVRDGAILASNTSYLDLDAMAAATKRPGDIVGLHFFSPANVMKLLEIVRGRETSRETLATALAFAKRLGKLPVVSANAWGFIGNRIHSQYRRQCEFMLEEGATPQQVDAAMEAFGYAMGPFKVADLSGLDIAWRIRKSQLAANKGVRDPGVRSVDFPDTLCEMGRFGRKTGAGYYRYSPDGKSPIPDPEVVDVIERSSATKGIVRRPFTDDEIQRRALLTMVNEASRLLAEGVAARPSDVDVVMANGYGFPRSEGGPVHWARQRDPVDLDRDLDWLARASGPGFIRGNFIKEPR